MINHGKQRGFALFMVIIVALFGIGGGLYYYSRNERLKAQTVSNAQSRTQTPPTEKPTQEKNSPMESKGADSEVAVRNSASEWKPYTDFADGVSFQYPSRYGLRETTSVPKEITLQSIPTDRQSDSLVVGTMQGTLMYLRNSIPDESRLLCAEGYTIADVTIGKQKLSGFRWTCNAHSAYGNGFVTNTSYLLPFGATGSSVIYFTVVRSHEQSQLSDSVVARFLDSIEIVAPRASTTTTELVVKNGWGVQFLVEPSWKMVTNNADQIVLSKITGAQIGDMMTLSYITGSHITDTDAKFGDLTYFYDDTRKEWVRVRESETTPAIEDNTSADGLPIFTGIGAWRTYIIALSQTTFLKLNISSGHVAPLNALLKTITKLK